MIVDVAAAASGAAGGFAAGAWWAWRRIPRILARFTPDQHAHLARKVRVARETIDT